jgi:two-component system alkaline phosphatase synthesis response regulator PhoP
LDDGLEAGAVDQQRPLWLTSPRQPAAPAPSLVDSKYDGSMRATVLLVEDEHSVGVLVQRYLQHEGHRPVWVRRGEEALTELGRHQIDLVILDIGLPDIDGFEVCRRITARSTVPIIMLTARDEEGDRVAGLEVGADDYVTKPFSPRELMARVKAVLRRLDRRDDRAETVQLGDVVVRAASHEVSVAGRAVELTPKEFELLSYLFVNVGVVLSREQLLDRVWGLEFPGGTRTVDVHVGQLRRKLERPDLIRTVRGSGYMAVDPAVRRSV